ncbi:hypothetical protein OC846_003033 [Tilletia horrida]|uniref:Uncharacterized protein n=1 Tax=Tilletia horrida TaxID=155126 RepID=A0AAN6JSE0_9BASI|nr:hypothetical protein OC846_003033 [Tilletia horrida]
MMLIPPHSSTPRWVPTAASSNSNVNNNGSSGVGAFGGNSSKAIATSKRKRDDDHDAQMASTSESSYGAEPFPASRRMRTDESMSQLVRPSIHPHQSGFESSSSFGPSLSHSSSSTSLLPTPSSDQPSLTSSVEFPSSSSGLSWLGHPVQTDFSALASGSSTGMLMMPSPPMTPSHSSSSMAVDGAFHQLHQQYATAADAMMEMDHPSHDRVWNGVDFPASMFQLHLPGAVAGHAHPYA